MASITTTMWQPPSGLSLPWGQSSSGFWTADRNWGQLELWCHVEPKTVFSSTVHRLIISAIELGNLLTKWPFWRNLWNINFAAWWQRISNLACRPSVAPDGADIQEMPPRFVPAIFSRCNFVYISTLETWGDKSIDQPSKILLWIVMPTFGKSCHVGLDCTASKTKAKLDPRANFPSWLLPDLHADAGWATHWIICQFVMAETCSIC